MWSDLHEAAGESHELRALADTLPDVLLSSRAHSTVVKYSGGFRRWKDWAQSHHLPAMPASPFHVVLYLRSLMFSANTASPVLTAVYSLDWAHRLAGEPCPGTHPLVSEFVNAAKRILAHHTKRKDPISVEQLERLVEDRASTSASLMDLRTVTAALLAFAAFLRFDELINLRVSDISFKDSYLLVFIESSKTDQYRDGAWVPIASSSKNTCPVKMLSRFFDLCGFTKSSDDPSFLFRGLSKTRKGYKVRSATNKISYSRLRELMIEAFSPYVEDVSSIGTHSLRSGGATAAARAGIPDRLFKRHGRWRSEKAKDGYIQDSMADRLSVSQSLGI